MAEPLLPGLRILLTNDDGIHAPGLEVLEDIAARLSEDVWVVAPETDQSGVSHSLTLHQPLRLRDAGPQRYALAGTPTDCVGVAVKHLFPEQKPDLVLSGVNNGSNLAEDVTYSGTVAGAMEGTVLGIRSIGLSQARGFAGREETPWDCAAHYGADLIAKLMAADWAPGILYNVNFPDALPGEVDRIEVTRQGRRDVQNLYVDERTDPRGKSYFWLGFKRELSNPPEGTDLRAIYSGRISVTPLHLDLTRDDRIAPLQEALGAAASDYQRGR